MPLPINIDDLLNGKTIVWERIEFREGWNPERAIRTICAFANDFNNWGGGYIILGVAEKKGLPVFPPVGLKLNLINTIQQELNQICRKIHPNYFPIAEPIDFQNKKILLLWCPGGSNRPYKAPETFGKTSKFHYYIRRYSSTVHPTRDEERELLGMANQIPYDDRANHHSSLFDFDLSTIKIFLNEIRSALEKDIANLTINEIARRMNIAEGGNENLLPKNVGLLFFAKNIHKFFPYAKIEFVKIKDESGTDYTEKIFEGAVHNQLKNALNYFKDSIVEEKILKQSGRAEALRFYNFPYEAFEEALCNAVYHRGYDNDSPIEVRIYPNRIDIISFPGPLPPLDKIKLHNYKFEVRKYRNRRIGEFLKELHLTEGRSTGIPTILREMKKNGSPKPLFETDEDRTYFKTTFKIHSKFTTYLNRLSTDSALSWHQVGTKLALSQHQAEILLQKCLTEQPITNLMEIFNWKDRTKYKKKFIDPMLKTELIAMTFPDKPKSSKQKYITTEKGKRLLNLKNKK